MKYEITQQSFAAITQLAALCNTPGVEEETIKMANEQIRLLLGVLKPEFQKLTATSNGLIV